jgi:hypothetical protein
VQGIAVALDIKCMAGVRNSQWISKECQSFPEQYFDYDAFRKTMPGTEGQNFFLMPEPIVERPLEQINVGHRRRTHLKRQFKRDIREASRSNFIDSFLLAADTVAVVRQPLEHGKAYACNAFGRQLVVCDVVQAVSGRFAQRAALQIPDDLGLDASSRSQATEHANYTLVPFPTGARAHRSNRGTAIRK